MHLSPLVSDWLVGEDEDRFPAPPPVVQAIPARLVDVRNAVHMANWWGVVFMFVSIWTLSYKWKLQCWQKGAIIFSHIGPIMFEMPMYTVQREGLKEQSLFCISRHCKHQPQGSTSSSIFA
jgi:hypothetical protein